MRKCPFCAEDIQEAAIKCRFCGEAVAPAAAAPATAASPPSDAALPPQAAPPPGYLPPQAGPPARPSNDLAKLVGSGCLIFVALFVGAIYFGRVSSSSPATTGGAQQCEQAVRAATSGAIPKGNNLDGMRPQLRKRLGLASKAKRVCADADGPTEASARAALEKAEQAMAAACSAEGRALVLVRDDATEELVSDCPPAQARTPEAPRSAITMANYQRLEAGMSYAAVVKILGAPGEELSSSEMAGIKTVMFMWSGPGISNMNAMFQNDKLVNKAQFGLE